MRTLEDFYNEFDNKDIEIDVFVTTGFGGAMPLAGNCQITSYFPAMIDMATNKLIEEDGRIEQVVSSEAFSKKQYASFKDNGIYRLVVSKCIPQELSPNVLPVINNRYLLKSIKSSYDMTNEPKELVVYREKYLEPVSIRIEDADFLLNRRFKWYEGETKYDGEVCQVYLKVDFGSNTKADSAMLCYSSVRKNLDQWVLRAKDKATEELLSAAIDCKDEDAEFSAEDFKMNMTPLRSLSFSNKGTFEMCFGDSDMFGGHEIMLRGSLDEGFSESDVVG